MPLGMGGIESWVVGCLEVVEKTGVNLVFPRKCRLQMGTGINLVIRGGSMAGGRNLVFRLLLSWLSAIATRRLQPVRLFCIEWRLKDHFHRNTQLNYSLFYQLHT